MKKFARIIDLQNGGQVLLTVDHDQEEEENYNLVARSDNEYLSMSMKFGFKTEDQAEKAMNDFTYEKAERLVKVMEELTN